MFRLLKKMKNVKKIGNKTEEVFCKLLQKNGIWCHLFATNKNGQPCDVVAVKNNIAYFIDVKHCDKNAFSFDDIQPNQKTTFAYNLKCGNNNLGFAIFYEDTQSFKWMSYQAYLEISKVKNSVKENEIGDFINEINNWGEYKNC